MSIGIWEPGNKKSVDIVELEKLMELLSCFQTADPEKLSESMSATQVQTNAGLMNLSEESWQSCDSLADEALEPLVRFFTLAEMQLAGWDSGAKSPVIYLVKVMKKRGLFTPELRKWIKKNSDNRYIPNGSVL
ncbi:MAG: hypothetical protein ACJAVI_000622 [Candidatus Azotimanducaceae bacterium]|jgi:hypothetical protein